MSFTLYNYFCTLVAKNGIENAAKFAYDTGFSSVEIYANTESFPFADENAAKYSLEVLKKYGLKVACYSVGADLYSKKTDTVQLLKKHVGIACALDSPLFHHTVISSFNPDILNIYPSFDVVFDEILTKASSVVAECKKYGITTIYEPQGMYVNGINNFSKFYGELKKIYDNLGVCGDIGNTLFVDTAPLDFYKIFAKEVKHVHIKDYSYINNMAPDCRTYKTINNNTLIEAALGKGDVNVKECIKLFKDAGYKGNYALETSYKDLNKSNFINDINYLKEILS